MGAPQTAYTQERQICKIATDLGEDVLLVKRLTINEGISSLFRLDAEFYSESADIDFKKIIGKPVSFRLLLTDQSERFFHGIVSRFSQADPLGAFMRYRAEIVPWLWLLTRSANCRIFQNKSVPDIIEQVFDDLKLKDLKVRLNASYDPRPYCVQYRETDFNFVSRLMEEEGISYYFEHGEKEHILILVDTPGGNAECPGHKEATYTSAVGAETRSAAAAGQIHEWQIHQELASGRYSINDFNFESPSTSLLACANSSIVIGGNERFELYDYPGEYTELDGGGARVKLRMEAEEAASIVVRGRSGCGAFSPGYHFKLVGHYSKDVNTKYLLTRVTHQIIQTVGEEVRGDEATYSNTFACIPYSIPYRPRQNTPKPIISGVQTATVVGASGEEIDVDKYGRVVVQFHWDREGKRDENSSCRVRVSQNWAGSKWGGVFHPRIGQEVIVEFVEGDPDRPIITGRVYNAEQMPPYELPANKTQSTVKSRSSKGADASNFNELRFEDKKGAELLYMQAELDRETLVKQDERKKVNRDQFLAVTRDQTTEIGNDRTESVGNDHSHTVGNDQTVKVTRNREDSVGGNEEWTVSGERTRSVGGAERVSVAKAQSITVDASRDLTVKKDLGVAVTGSHTEQTKNAYSLEAKTISFEAKDKLEVKVGSVSIVLRKNGDIQVKGGKIQVKGSKDVIIKGSKIKEN